MGITRYAAALAAILVLACGPSAQDPDLGSAAGEDPGDPCAGSPDGDGDGWSECKGDCNDGDASSYPTAPEIEDGVDNDCNGAVDDNLSNVDDDGDGYSDDDGDCNDNEPLVSPSAVEVDTIIDDNGAESPEGVDNDCDGQIDEGNPPCDTSLSASAAGDYAKAMELCDWVTDSTFNAGSDARGRNILGGFGSTYAPGAGSSFAVLSTGIAVDSSDNSFKTPNGGTAFTNSASHPDPQGDPGDGCGNADPGSVNDTMELSFEIEVPSNAQALSYDFNFMSGEFPEFVCTTFDDTFMAILESSSFTGNISFDAQGRPVTINIGFFDVCATTSDPACNGDGPLQGTGHEGGVGGGTGWLTTTAPVTPGETITLRFLIFDEGDHIYDSLVLLDNFRWQGTGVDDPITVERAPPGNTSLNSGDTPWHLDAR